MKNETTKISKNKQKKMAIVAQVSEKVGKARAMVFTNYQGLTHKQLEELKKALKKTNAELSVTKNTLLRIALKDHNISDIADKLQSPTATIFAYDDPIAPLKELTKMIKRLKLPAIKFGMIEGKVLFEKDVVRLSTLPPKEVLIGQFVSNLKAPLYGLHRALSWNLQKLVLTLSAIEKSKGT